MNKDEHLIFEQYQIVSEENRKDCLYIRLDWELDFDGVGYMCNANIPTVAFSKPGAIKGPGFGDVSPTGKKNTQMLEIDQGVWFDWENFLTYGCDRYALYIMQSSPHFKNYQTHDQDGHQLDYTVIVDVSKHYDLTMKLVRNVYTHPKFAKIALTQVPTTVNIHAVVETWIDHLYQAKFDETGDIDVAREYAQEISRKWENDIKIENDYRRMPRYGYY